LGNNLGTHSDGGNVVDKYRKILESLLMHISWTKSLLDVCLAYATHTLLGWTVSVVLIKDLQSLTHFCLRMFAPSCSLCEERYRLILRCVGY
jgi:hypothetical protein